MQKCKICGKPTKYATCWEHRNTPYIDICKIHGRTTFIGGKCQKCEQDKIPIYTIKKKNGKYYGKNNEELKSTDLTKRLTHLNRKYQEKYFSNITSGPGIYAIFVRDSRRVHGCGTCLYVGQSVDVKQRVSQHKEAFKTAQKHMQGIRIRKSRLHLSKINRKVEFKYYEMAYKYRLSDLKFVKVVSLSTTDPEILTYAEEAMMQALKPKYNTKAARPRASK